MGFNTDKIVDLKLPFLDVTLILVALDEYKQNHDGLVKKPILDQTEDLILRLGRELFDEQK